MSEEHNFDRDPFYPKYLEGDERKSKQDKVQVTVDYEERKMLEELKKLLDCPFDSKIFKLALRPLHNILSNQLGEKNMRYISSERRKRSI